VTLTAYDGTGHVITHAIYTVPAGQEISINTILSALGIAPQSDVDLEVESDLPSAVYAWASMVDNLSTDQTFVRPLLIP